MSTKHILSHSDMAGVTVTVEKVIPSLLPYGFPQETSLKFIYKSDWFEEPTVFFASSDLLYRIMKEEGLIKSE
jgi:hypothetical protein